MFREVRVYVARSYSCGPSRLEGLVFLLVVIAHERAYEPIRATGEPRRAFTTILPA